MKREYKQLALLILGFIAIFFILGLAGRTDYTEQIIYTMPDSAYDSIKAELGNNSTDYEIAKEYIKCSSSHNK
ncbi:MAG: hypothetical protein H6Q13_3339 [Bacteroidetes bacterium]|nr:hypothetical protein [Bacteroidota bacterium]